MHELQRIHDAVTRLLAAGTRGLLITVIGTSGSTYRPGARSVIGEDGSIDGAISGGCVERDIAERARSWLGDLSPRVVTYDGAAVFAQPRSDMALRAPRPLALLEGGTADIVPAVPRKRYSGVSTVTC